MKFSIIIPVYNVRNYICECLESILNQSYRDLEIICIDDCSTDDGWAILVGYSQRDARVHVYKNDYNQGLSITRNRGLDLAEGDYIWFIDSDDYIMPGALNVLSETIDQWRTDAVYFGLYTMSENKSICNIDYSPDYSKCPISGREFFFTNIRHNPQRALWNVAWNAVYRREYLKSKDLKFKEGIYSEDWLFRFQFAMLENSVIGISNKLYVYRKRKGGITSSGMSEYAHYLFYILLEVVRKWETEDFSEEEEKLMDIYCTRIYRVMMQYYIQQDKMKDYNLGTALDNFIWRMTSGNCYSFLSFSDEQISIIRNARRVWIYGAGVIGREVARYLVNNWLEFEGFLITRKEAESEQILGHNVMVYEKGKIRKEDIIIIAVSSQYVREITEQIKDAEARIISLNYNEII